MAYLYPPPSLSLSLSLSSRRRFRSTMSWCGISLFAVFASLAQAFESHAGPRRPVPFQSVQLSDSSRVPVKTREELESLDPSRGIKLPLSDGEIELRMADASLFTEEARVRVFGEGARPEIVELPRVFFGSVDGSPGSRATLVISSVGVYGTVFIRGGSTWVLEPLMVTTPNAEAGDIRLYRQEDVDLSEERARCSDDDVLSAIAPEAGRVESPAHRGEVETTVGQAGVPSPSSATLESGSVVAFTVQAVADSTFLANFGTDPATAITAAAAKVTAQLAFARSWLQRDVGLSLRVKSIDIRTAANDPFLPPGNLYTQLRAYRASQIPNEAAVYQLSYNGPKSTCNFLCEGQAASLDSICTENGLSINYRPATGTLVFSSILAAHEIGHVLNAIHSNGTQCGALRIPVSVCFGGSKGGLGCDSLLDCCANGPDNCTLEELSGGVGCFENPYRPIMWPGVSLSSEDDAEYEACAIGRITNENARIWQEDSCAYPIQCGDADANGSITAADALLALQLSQCSGCAYNALADVYPLFAEITAVDALAILRIATGSEEAPETCGPL